MILFQSSYALTCVHFPLMRKSGPHPQPFSRREKGGEPSALRACFVYLEPSALRAIPFTWEMFK